MRLAGLRSSIARSLRRAPAEILFGIALVAVALSVLAAVVILAVSSSLLWALLLVPYLVACRGMLKQL